MGSNYMKTFYQLPLDVQYEIDMILYDEFNVLYCQEENKHKLTEKDLKIIRQAEKNKRKILIKKYLDKCAKL